MLCFDQNYIQFCVCPGLNIFEHQVQFGVCDDENDNDDELTSLIIAPVAGGMLFVALVGLVVFFNMAKKKRSQHGTYNPQKQEFMAPRMELNYMLKPPIEERLI